MSDTLKNTSLNAKLSEDLTVILLRGNGSPRTFRLSVAKLQRSLTGLGFAFAFAIAAAALLLLWNLLHLTSDRVVEVVQVAAPAAPAPSAPAAPPAKTGFWNNLSAPAGDDVELKKEVQGLRDDIAKMQSEAQGRHDLASGVNQGLLQFFGATNVADAASTLQVKNVKVSRAGNDLAVDFEVTNVDPDQKQVRGYIVVLAKTPNMLLSYPEGAFNPDQNVVLDHTKGETFGVSRLRPTRATFPAAALDGKHPRFQILLFGTNGKVLSDLHVEGQ